jgi:RNA polymerase sigma-70 factor (ECF subfamily)
MNEHEWLADRFEEHRSHLRAVAYRMLGSLTEADDAVQDTWLRLSRSESGEVENLGGWLTTVIARVCLNMLRARNVRREESFEAHLPDPVISRDGELQPEQEALLADSVGLALLVVLDTLAPAERLAFILHDMFQLPFEEIAPIVGRTPTAARQLASKARRRVKGADGSRAGSSDRQHGIAYGRHSGFVGSTLSQNHDREILRRNIRPGGPQAALPGVPAIVQDRESIAPAAAVQKTETRPHVRLLHWRELIAGHLGRGSRPQHGAPPAQQHPPESDHVIDR